MKADQEKINLNKQLPYLVGYIVEVNLMFWTSGGGDALQGWWRPLVAVLSTGAASGVCVSELLLPVFASPSCCCRRTLRHDVHAFFDPDVPYSTTPPLEG